MIASPRQQQQPRRQSWSQLTSEAPVSSRHLSRKLPELRRLAVKKRRDELRNSARGRISRGFSDSESVQSYAESYAESYAGSCFSEADSTSSAVPLAMPMRMPCPSEEPPPTETPSKSLLHVARRAGWYAAAGLGAVAMLSVGYFITNESTATACTHYFHSSQCASRSLPGASPAMPPGPPPPPPPPQTVQLPPARSEPRPEGVDTVEFHLSWTEGLQGGGRRLLPIDSHDLEEGISASLPGNPPVTVQSVGPDGADVTVYLAGNADPTARAHLVPLATSAVTAGEDATASIADVERALSSPAFGDAVSESLGGAALTVSNIRESHREARPLGPVPRTATQLQSTPPGRYGSVWLALLAAAGVATAAVVEHRRSRQLQSPRKTHTQRRLARPRKPLPPHDRAFPPELPPQTGPTYRTIATGRPQRLAALAVGNDIGGEPPTFTLSAVSLTLEKALSVLNGIQRSSTSWTTSTLSALSAPGVIAGVAALAAAGLRVARGLRAR